MADSQQAKQKLSEEEKIKLIKFYKDNKALWSSEVSFRNKEEKAEVKEEITKLFEGKFTDAFLDKSFHALRTAFGRELKKYKEKEPKKKWKFFDQLSFLKEEFEKIEKKITFDVDERETLIDFFNSNSPLWNHHLTEYRDRNLRDSLYEKLAELFDGKFSKEDLKREWHNLHTIYKREMAREEGASTSGSGTCDVYVSTWEHFSQMQFLDITDDVDASYTSLDSESFAQPPKKCKKSVKTGEEVAKTELWKSLAASLKPQAVPQPKTGKNELAERADLFGKVVADSLLQYEPEDSSYPKKKVMDVFFEFEQQKLTGRSNYQSPAASHFNPNQFQGNQFRQGPYFNMLTNNASNSQIGQFDPFSPPSTPSDAS